jgi:UDP-GlcNAc:undecaprenyl-phosphate GlcNAc-1-phosphate transferase
MLIISVIANGLLLKFSVSMGRRNENQEVRWSSTTKPAFGGISFYILFLFSFVFHVLFFSNDEIMLNAGFIGFFTTTSLGFAMGLADDAYNTKPFLKFSVQFICGFIFLITGNVISIFTYEWLNYLFTMLWVVGLMNSINMLDNMDAITSSTSFIIISSAIAIIIFNTQYPSIDLTIFLGTISAIAGFLYYNWNPSRMYMGDSGSQFLGVFLAYLGIKYFWNGADYYGAIVPAKQFLIAILVFAVPLSDTATVTINRLMKGKSPFVGGRDHTTHHLSYLGFTDRQVAFIMIIISLITMFTSVIVINGIKEWTHTHTFIFGALFLIIFLTLYSISRISKPKPKVIEDTQDNTKREETSL